MSFRINTPNENGSLSQSFKGEPVKVAPEVITYLQGQPPNRIILPSLSIDIPVRISPIKQGYWVVYKDSAGFGEGSTAPGNKGNTVIFAHAREGLFLGLKTIRIGARIYVFTQDRYFTYIVTEIKEVLPNDIEVISPTIDETLTLYTCSGFLDKKRLIVIGKPI